MEKIRIVHFTKTKELVFFSSRNEEKFTIMKPEPKLVLGARSLGNSFTEYDGDPVEDLSIEVTSRCNLSCKHCSHQAITCEAKNMSKLDLPISSIIKFFKEFQDLGGLRVALTGGEPLTRCDLFEILEAANKLDLDTNIATNGTLIDGPKATKIFNSGVSTVGVSLHGATKETHEGLTNTPDSFEKALFGIQALKKNSVNIRINTVLHCSVLPELVEMAKLLQQYEINNWCLNILYPTGNAVNCYSQLSPTLPETIQAVKKVLGFISESGFSLNVEGIIPYALLTPNPVKPCLRQFKRYIRLCKDHSILLHGNNSLVIGDYSKQSLEKIWASPETNRLRNMTKYMLCSSCLDSQACSALFDRL
jgi:MoaA/NifB/PqqE/SkfB family radical SAM enzyme